MFEPGPELTTEHAATILTTMPGALGRIAPATATCPARWVPVPGRTALSRVDAESVAELSVAVDEFFSTPLRADRAVSAARLVTGLADGRRALLVKLHHCLGDGMAVMQALLSDTDDAARLSWAAAPAPPASRTGVSFLRAGMRPIVTGLRALATAGRSPNSPTDGPLPDARRNHVLARLPGRAVRTAARAHEVSVAEFLLAVFAQAWHDAGTGGSERFRLMVPWSVRGTDSLRVAGNHTGAVSVDLPVGTMEFGDRVRRVASTMRSHIDAGVPVAANLVVHLLGVLPPALHRAAARHVYRETWFNGVGTVMPGPRREVRWHGSVLSEAYPVLALAPGTGLAWGALTWGPWITLCVTVAPESGPLAGPLTKRMTDLVTDVVA